MKDEPVFNVKQNKKKQEQMRITPLGRAVGVLNYLNLTIYIYYLTKNLNKHKSIM